MNKRKLFGRTIKGTNDIRPVLEKGLPNGQFAIVKGKKAIFRGTLKECKEMEKL